jgi:hypothetical protein
MFGIDEWLSREASGHDPIGKPVGRGLVLQRGSGAYSLCRACNERAGARYVPELARWVEMANTGLANARRPVMEFDEEVEPAYSQAHFKRVQPARFLKQVVTMLLAVAPAGFALHRDNLDLSAFAQDPDWVGLPERFQLYLALYLGPYARFNGGSGVMHLEDDRFITDFVLEVAHPPFTYILSVDQEKPTLDCGNISNFADLRIDQTADVEIHLRLGFGHTPFPLDFRSRAAVLAQRAETRREEARRKLWTPLSDREQTD